MTNTLTEVASYDATLTLPSPGDDATIDSLVAAFQMLLDRSAYTHQSIEVALASVAALQALTGMPDGAVRLVAGLGFYSYSASSTASNDGIWVLTPTSGTGRWLHTLYQLHPRNGLIDITRASASGSANTVFQATSTGSFADVTGVYVVVAGCQVGDILDVSSFATFSTSSLALQLVAIDGGTAVVLPESLVHLSLSSVSQLTCSPAGVHVVTTASDVTVKLQVNAGGVSASLYTPTAIAVRRFRP